MSLTDFGSAQVLTASILSSSILKPWADTTKPKKRTCCGGSDTFSDWHKGRAFGAVPGLSALPPHVAGPGPRCRLGCCPGRQ